MSGGIQQSSGDSSFELAGVIPTAPRGSWQQLAAAQNVPPVGCASELYGDFWPEEESIEEFLSALAEWRREGPG